MAPVAKPLPLSPGGRRYGALSTVVGPTEPRSKVYSAVPIPPQVDERPHDGPVKDQGQEGSCTAHAGASVVEWIRRRYYKDAPILSPAFLYAEELLHDGTFPGDNGSEPASTCWVLNQRGICELADMPYTAGSIVAPNAAQEAAALKYKLGGYHALWSLGDFLSAIGNPTPWLPVVAFDVYESFESSATATTGIMQVPKDGEALLGGHQVKASGYDLDKKMALMQNSWGTGWGLTGYFWMPFEVLEKSAMRIIHPGHW